MGKRNFYVNFTRSGFHRMPRQVMEELNADIHFMTRRLMRFESRIAHSLQYWRHKLGHAQNIYCHVIYYSNSLSL